MADKKKKEIQEKEEISMPNHVLTRHERTAKILEESYEKDHKPVTGVFRWYESPNGILKFGYGSKYSTDGIMHFELEDERSYTLPRMVAEHINSRYRIIPKHRIDKDGKRHQEAGKRKQRMAFIPTEFMDSQTLREIENGGASAIINITR